ncbi:YdcF family protein [Metabacillus idriensis]|uniref:YdcF family protein n=1 Tax=Metabacillus idriensis TaxID=324768 RepID=UPI00174889E9|nr:YdcF family protein [Metabacillus idriensis]
MKIRKFTLLLFKMLLIAVLVLFVYASASIWHFGNHHETVKTDAAIVLGAAAWGEEPSPVFKERINHAIRLYKNGDVSKIIFTGGKAIQTDLPEAAVGKNYALKQQVKESDILIETNSRLTVDNLKYAFEEGKKAGLHTYTIVSDPYHMKRSLLLAEKLGMDAYSSPTTTSAYRTWETKLPVYSKEVLFYAGYLVTSPFE